MFDDDDLALRAKQAVAHDLFVHHFGSRTITGSGIDTEALLAENRAKFAAKWGVAAPAGREVALRPWSAESAVVAMARGPRPKVSLTMIVRDEEDNLPACLDSAAGLFDEVVVVDTGSTDRTREIALAHGAKVFEFPWVDSFSAARNTEEKSVTRPCRASPACSSSSVQAWCSPPRMRLTIAAEMRAFRAIDEG